MKNFREKLIKKHPLEGQVVSARKYLHLEERIPHLLDEALAVLPIKRRPVKLFSDGTHLYETHLVGVAHYWKGQYPNGDPVTNTEDLSRASFLAWVYQQPQDIQRQVYHNLRDYLATKTPQECGEEFPRSEYI